MAKIYKIGYSRSQDTPVKPNHKCRIIKLLDLKTTFNMKLINHIINTTKSY